MKSDRTVNRGLVILALALCPAACDFSRAATSDGPGPAQDGGASPDAGGAADGALPADSALPADGRVPAPDTRWGCSRNSHCPKDRYCFFASGCGNKGTGVCKKRPAVCGGPVQYVCGCDDNTYNSPCAAAQAGQSIAHQGMCGCKTNCDCPQGQGCDAPTGTCVLGIVPVYCCTKPGCPKGEKCTNPDGSSSTCR
jgi:hypothetical protein